MRPRKSQLGLFEAIWRPFRFSSVDSHLDGPTIRTSQHVKYQSGFSRRYSIRTYCDSHFAVELPICPLRKVELLCGAHSDFELKAMDVASLSRTAVHKYNTSLSGFNALFLTFRLCEQHGLGVNAMSDLVTLIGSIMGDGIRQAWWPTSRWKSCWVFQTSKGNLTPYTISAPSANAASTTCNRTNAHLHRRRFAGNQIATANGSARRVLRWLHHSWPTTRSR